jgi:hypothetical protein
MNKPTSNPSQGAASERRLQWWWRLPVALATVVGMSQIYLAHRANLTPAKGGGFGLFSTFDKLENRNFRAYLITPKQEIPFVIPRNLPADEPLRKPIQRSASLPIDRHLRVIVDDLLSKPYQQAGKSSVDVKGVRVEVWKMAFEPATLKASRVKIAELSASKER